MHQGSANPLHSAWQRRRFLWAAPGVTWGAWATLSGCSAGLAQTSPNPTPNPPATQASNPTADAWRAMSRLGYGPTPALIGTLQAAPDARTWALQQIESAYAASQSAPAMAPETQAINATLPQIFDGAQRERQARAATKAGEQPETGDANFNRSMIQKTAAWRLGACSRPETEPPLLARLTEFWFNHLNVYIGKGPVRPFVGHYLIHVARAHALGRFEDLLLASARHPAMLFYLDQWQSVANGTRGSQGSTRGLNENYARELMELHTLGVDGGYSQNDVRELARVLTGWTVNARDESGFRFAARQHDDESKVVLGQHFPDGLFGRGEAEGERAIRMLARHPSTARRVSLRLARFFVADQPPPELVQRLSRIFLASEGNLRAVMQALLESPEFWNPENRLFKTPMDFACSALAATRGADDPRKLLLTAGFLNNAGQPLHGWQTPDGYPFDAATWLVPEALTRRADFALAVARQVPEVDFLLPYFSAQTRATLARERPALRAGLALASPDFMSK